MNELIFLGESTRRQAPVNSHNRLFGEADRNAPATPKNHFKSNIPFGGDAVDAVKATNGKATNGNGVALNGNGHANGNGHGNGHANGNGNGVAHDSHKGQNGESTPHTNGTNGHKSGGFIRAYNIW